MMRVLRILFLLFVAGTAWAYWTNLQRASVWINVNDEGRSYKDRLHGVSLEFFDAEGSPLARARTVEPTGYYVVIHPDPATDDCRQYESQATSREFADCFKRQSYWISTWAERVSTASFAWGDCTIPSAPVLVTTRMSAWLLWWLALPHAPFSPYRSISLELEVNTAMACDQGAKPTQAP